MLGTDQPLRAAIAARNSIRLQLKLRTQGVGMKPSAHGPYALDCTASLERAEAAVERYKRALFSAPRTTSPTSLMG